MLLTRWQGQEAERKDGAIHTVALPPRARPHHVLDPRLQLPQQRLGPAAPLGCASRRLHGAADDSEDTSASAAAAKALSTSGGGPGRSQARGWGHPPLVSRCVQVTGRLWPRTAAGRTGGCAKVGRREAGVQGTREWGAGPGEPDTQDRSGNPRGP